MNKKILAIACLIVIIIVVLFLKIGTKDENVSEDMVYQNTISISRTYVALRLKTDKVLKEASTYPDYNTWNDEMSELINNWKNLEEKASILEKQADFGDEEKVSFKLVNEANAYTKDEISNVFDRAPAGRKIRTLAKYLGVDAKRAYKILQNDQEYVKADAWNKAGDTFQKLETSAVVIKDGCKVVGFVGAVAITGGAAGAVGSAGVGAGLTAGSVTAGQAVVLVVTGTDLMLEVGEDTVTIALGDKHKTVKAISGIRSYTDPAASILSLTDIPSNISKGAKLLDKVGVVLMQVDQIRSMVQDGKLLGINIRPDSKVEISSLEKDEVEEWIEEHMREDEDDDFKDLDDWLDSFEDLDDWLDEFESEEATEEEEELEDELEAEEAIEEEVGLEYEEKAEDEGLEKVYTKDGKVSIAIANIPEPLSRGHTKMWEIKVDGYERLGEKKGYECYWDFYTEYALDAKPWMNLQSCKSIRPVPGKFRPVGDPPGELRIVVRVEFLEQNYGINQFGNKTQDGNKIVETVTVEKTYVVTPWGGMNSLK